MIHGAFLIDKPRGLTSFDIIRKFQRNFKGHDLKIGHTGTLDPFATGLLIVLVGKATALSQVFLKGNKTYLATLCFGVGNASGDITDAITEQSSLRPTLQSLQAASECFVKEVYEQLPPMTSAKKINGKALYHYARQGQTVPRAKNFVQIEKIEFCQELSHESFFDSANSEKQGAAINPFAHLDLLAKRIRPIPSTQNSMEPLEHIHFLAKASSGTYIRVLGQDLAQKAGSIGLLTHLRRIQSGPFTIQNALTLEEMHLEQYAQKQDLEQLKNFIPLDRLLDHTPIVQTVESLRVSQGHAQTLNAIKAQAQSHYPAPWIGLKSQEGQLIALLNLMGDTYSVSKVFPLTLSS